MTASETTPRETSPLVKPLKTIVRFVNGPSGTQDDGNNEDTLSVDETLDLLSSARRRAVIEQLAASDQARMRVSDLAESVAGVEYECEPSEVTSDERKRIYISLIQSHLPPLDKREVVNYDEDAKIVATGPQFGVILRANIALQEALS